MSERKIVTKEGRDELRDARVAGKQAAYDAVDWEKNSAWMDYLDDNVSTLLRENPGKRWSKKELRRYAKDILIDVAREAEVPHKIGRQSGWSDDYYFHRLGVRPQDVRQAWSDAMHSVLSSKGMISWLVDELTFQLDQRK